MKDDSSKKRRIKRTKKNQEIIFDFMDAYRPPFRHHLMQAFRELTLQPEDFKWGYDEWKRKVYYVPKKSKVKYQLQKLFKEVWEREFYYQKKGWRNPRKRSLKTIMLIDALDFERFLSRKYIRHTPFHAYEDPQIKAFVDFFYELFEFITQYKAPSTTSPPKVTKARRRRSTSTHALPQNVIIVTHNDWDGFASALLLLLKNYDHHPNIRIIVAHNQPTRPLFIRKVLKRQVRRLLLKEAYNRIIVADFAINWTEGFFHELKLSYEQALGDFKTRFKISWYDHHTQPRADLDNLRMKVGMNIHYNPRMDTYRTIWREMSDEFIKLDKQRRELSVILNLFKIILKHQSSTIPLRLNQLLRTLSISFSKYLKQLGKKQARDLLFIFGLSRKGRVNKKLIRDYLDKWYKWFQYYWRKESHRPKNWTQLFTDIVLLKKIPQVPLQPQEELPLSEPPVHISRHQTRAGQTFDALISRHPTSFEGVMTHLPRPHPQVLLSQWEDYAISVRSLNRAVKVIGLLLDQGNIRAHETTGPIYFPRKPLLRLTRMDPVRSKEITINGVGFLDELAERLVKSTKLSADPHDLFPMEIGDIEKQEIKLPGIHFFAKDEATQAEIGKLVRKGRKGVLPIAFPCGKILLLEYGITTLFFTFLRNENKLSYFLHYLLRSYLADTRCQTVPNPPKMLYIDTTEFSLQLRYLTNPSMTKADLENVLHLQIDDFPQLMHFIEVDLKHLIRQENIELILIRGVFDLFDEHLAQETLTRQMFYFKRSEKGRHLLVRLYTIAKETHSCILLTRTRAWTQDIPDFVDEERIRPALAHPFLDVLEEKPKFFFHQTKKKFHLAPEAHQVRGEGNDLRIEYPNGCKKIARPLKKTPKDQPMPEFLKDVIWNLNNLAKSPPITPEVTGPLKYAQPEWKAKLEDIPTLYKTPHGVVFIAWRFTEYITNLFDILRQETTPRDFDLIRWYDGNYRIYNSRVKLSELLALGGIEKGEGRYKGRSMQFESTSKKGMPFADFVQYLVDHPLEFPPLPSTISHKKKKK